MFLVVYIIKFGVVSFLDDVLYLALDEAIVSLYGVDF